MARSVFARRRSLPASLGRALLTAIQGLGEGVRGVEFQDAALAKYGPDWRDRLERERRLHDLTARGRELELERAPRLAEAERLENIAKRQAILDKALQAGALQVEGEAGRVEDLPHEQIMVPGEEGGRGYMLNLPSPATVPAQPQLPAEIRGLFPDLDDAALTRAIRGAHAGTRRQLAALQGELRRQLEGERLSGRLQVVGAQGEQARQTEGVRQEGRIDLEGVRQPNREALARLRGEEARTTRTTPAARPEGSVTPEERAAAREFSQAVQALRARLSALQARKRGGGLSAEGEQQVDFEIDQIGNQLQALLARGRGAIRPAAPAAAATPAPTPTPSPVAAAPAAPRFVRYQGQVVPFDSLPPEVQALVLQLAGGR
jgi:hypothetical protein